MNKMTFKGTVIITDPCYIAKNRSDWVKCQYGEQMEKLKIHNCITRNTIYGDWSCTTYNTDNREVIGNFCADAGMVGVFLLDEVLKYNPDFNYHTYFSHTTTTIPNFNGSVEFQEIDNSVYVIGTGNINFKTEQTGLL